MTKISVDKSIAFDELSFGYPGKEIIFEKLTLDLNGQNTNKGYIVALMGASGVGKSSLLNIILGVEQPLSGTITIRPYTTVVSYLPQEPVLFEHLTPLQNAAYFSTIAAFKNKFDSVFFRKMSVELGMDKILQHSSSIKQLSGGEKQRLMLLRSLSIRPDILLLDEPTNGLDSETKLRFLTLLREIIVQNQVMTIYCTHNKTECDLIADDILFVSSYPVNGQKVFYSSYEEFSISPPTVEAYKAINYPVANLLSCRLDSNQYIIPTTDSDPESFYIALNHNHLSVSANGTINYKISGFNSVYTQINIEGQIINLPAADIQVKTDCRLSLNGKLITYHHDQSFARIVHFVNGKYSSNNE